MAYKSREQKQECVQKIIDLTRAKGRLTVKEACDKLSMHRDTAAKYFRAAVNTGFVVRYGRLGLFPDQRAIINFDLKRFNYRKNAHQARAVK